MKFIRYDLEYNPCNLHPQDAIKDLGFKEIHGVPQSIGCCWWFCVEDYDFDIKEKAKEDERYGWVRPMEPYNLNYWRDKCWQNCEYFKKSFDEKTKTHYDEWSCWGGFRCLKERKENEVS